MELGSAEHEVSVGDRKRRETHLSRLADEAGNLAYGVAN
jgi:hypothetical protein